MPPSVQVRLSLARSQCIRGESVPFTLEVANPGPDPYGPVATIEPLNDVTRITATIIGGGKPISGGPLSLAHREGRHLHGVEEPKTVTLLPGQKMHSGGDLLEWLGELEPGAYQLTATYRGIFDTFESAPVTLTVIPAAGTALSTPRHGHRATLAPEPSAWLHDGPEGPLVMFELRSRRLPANLLRGIRIPGAAQATALTAASMAAADQKFGHALWLSRGRLHLATVEHAAPTKTPAAVPVKLPVRGTFLHSPLSMPDGSVLVPFSEPGANSISLLRCLPDGAATSFEIGLAPAAPHGPTSCCWELLRKLHFAWVGPGGREVRTATLFLDDPGAGAQTRVAHFADAPVSWIHLYIDPNTRVGGPPTFQDEVPPNTEPVAEPPAYVPILWTVVRRDANLACTRGPVGAPAHRTAATFDCSRLRDPKVLTSAVTSDGGLCLLIASADGALYYASTSNNFIAPVRDLTGQHVTPDQQPGLITSSEEGTLGWVYLHYLDPAKGRVAAAKLEPRGEPEPRRHG